MEIKIEIFGALAKLKLAVSDAEVVLEKQESDDEFDMDYKNAMMVVDDAIAYLKQKTLMLENGGN